MDRAVITEGAWKPYEFQDGFSELIGPIWTLAMVGMADEFLRFGFTVGNKHCNRIGICHGGLLATMVDYAMGLNANMATGIDTPTPTISMTIDFMRAAKLGDWIESRTNVLVNTRRVSFAECKLVSKEGLIARASAVFKRSAINGNFSAPAGKKNED